MANKLTQYTRQKFFDTALRRCAEAKVLLNPPHKRKHCDGAVTCGLLATECALKATLLHGHVANSPDELSDAIRNQAFEGSTGHSVAILWKLQSAQVKNLATANLTEALNHLSGPNRYEHRYGVKRPISTSAQPFVESCRVVVEWMEQVIK